MEIFYFVGLFTDTRNITKDIDGEMTIFYMQFYSKYQKYNYAFIRRYNDPFDSELLHHPSVVLKTGH